MAFTPVVIRRLIRSERERVFSYKKYLAWCEEYNQPDGGWAIGCDGQEIFIMGEKDHMVKNVQDDGDYGSAEEWEEVVKQ